MKKKERRFPILAGICLIAAGCAGAGPAEEPEEELAAVRRLMEAGHTAEAALFLELCEKSFPDCLVPETEVERLEYALLLAGAGATGRAEELLDYPFTGNRLLEAKLLSFRISGDDAQAADSGLKLAAEDPRAFAPGELLFLSVQGIESGREEEVEVCLRELAQRSGYGFQTALLRRKAAALREDAVGMICAEAEAGLYMKSYAGELPALERTQGDGPAAVTASFFAAYFGEDYCLAERLAPGVLELFPGTVPPALAFVEAALRNESTDGEGRERTAAELARLEPSFRELPLFYTTLASAAEKLENGRFLRRSCLEKAIASAPASCTAMQVREAIWKEEAEGSGFFLLPEECFALAASPLLGRLPVLADPLVAMLGLRDSRFSLAAREALVTAMEEPAVRLYLESRSGDVSLPSGIRSALRSLF